MRFPDGLGAIARSQALVVPADLPGTLAQWLGWPPERFASPAHCLLPLVRWQETGVRQCVVMRSGPHDWAVRTPAWHLRVDGVDESRRVELYAKPSDRCEVNDIADRAPDIVAGLLDVLAQAQAAPTVEPIGLESAAAGRGGLSGMPRPADSAYRAGRFSSAPVTRHVVQRPTRRFCAAQARH